MRTPPLQLVVSKGGAANPQLLTQKGRGLTRSLPSVSPGLAMKGLL